MREIMMTIRSLLSTALKFVGFIYLASSVIGLISVPIYSIFNHQLNTISIALSLLFGSIFGFVCALS